ncbi:MAG: hypothetical protein M3Q32_01140 [Pseudomonadota bacterium]|nr:hypothetical protein [Pseudomonadota bacterium]
MMRVRGIAFGILILSWLGGAITPRAAAEQDGTGETAKLKTAAAATAAGTIHNETEGEPASVFVSEPRPFGYVIGDLVERTITMIVAEPARLQADSIPKAGRYGAWLELRRADLDSHEVSRSIRYRLTLTYQIMNVAPEVQTIELPPLRFSFDRAPPFAREVAGWPITVAPLTPEFVLARGGLEALRTDRAPPLIDTSAHRSRLWLYAALFAIVLSMYAWARFGAVWLARKPFARAYREIGKLEGNQSREAYRAALRATHRAFDETNGATVFFEQAAAFLDKHPRFAPLRDEIEQFFALSRDEFFGGGSEASHASPRKTDAASNVFLQTFCRAMREREAARSDASHAHAK